MPKLQYSQYYSIEWENIQEFKDWIHTAEILYNMYKGKL